MSNPLEGAIITFPNLMDVRIVRINDEIKRGASDYCGHFEYTLPSQAPLKDNGIDDVVLKICFSVKFADGVNYVPDESSEMDAKVNVALSCVAHQVRPSGWNVPKLFHMVPVDSLCPNPTVTKRRRRGVVDTWSTNEIRLSARLDGDMNWVRLEDHERKIAELEAQLSKVTE